MFAERSWKGVKPSLTTIPRSGGSQPPKSRLFADGRIAARMQVLRQAVAAAPDCLVEAKLHCGETTPQAAPEQMTVVKMTNPIRILIVDDHPIFRDGLAFLLASQADLLCVGQAETPAAAAAAFGALSPDVTLMDLRLGGSDGAQGVRAILQIDPAARIVVLTTSESKADEARLLTLGAAAYVQKSMKSTRLLQTIREVHAGIRP